MSELAVPGPPVSAADLRQRALGRLFARRWPLEWKVAPGPGGQESRIQVVHNEEFVPAKTTAEALDDLIVRLRPARPAGEMVIRLLTALRAGRPEASAVIAGREGLSRQDRDLVTGTLGRLHSRLPAADESLTWLLAEWRRQDRVLLPGRQRAAR